MVGIPKISESSTFKKEKKEVNMVWPFIFALIFIIFSWRDFYNLADSFLDRCAATFFLVVFAALVFALGILFASIISLVVPSQWTGPESTKLVSLRNSDCVSGHFFLGTGSIDATQYYFFYKEAGEGYKPGKIKVADNVTVFEDKREDGQLKTYTHRFINPSFGWIAADWPWYKYEFVIPEGSLKKNFTL